MKNPNGYGTVRKLSGKRRKPWAALAPAREVPGNVGVQRQLIGCFETRAEAMTALGAWNKNPSLTSVDLEKITLEQLYKEYIKLPKYKNLSQQTKDCYHAAWGRLSVLGKYKVKDLRVPHFQMVIDAAEKSGLSHSSLHKTKVFAGLLCDYAVQSDITSKNYASFIVLPKAEQKEKVPFSDLDLKKLEDAAKDGFMYADLILIMCYTGWRINEFLSLTPFSYDKEKRTLTGGSKTEAGKNRTVPVSDKVLPYFNKWLEKGGETIICREYNKKLIKVTDKYFRDNWYYPTLEALGLPKLTPHATRHTFASMLHRAGADKWDIQRLMGHSSSEITNKVYTHVDVEQLKEAVNLL